MWRSGVVKMHLERLSSWTDKRASRRMTYLVFILVFTIRGSFRPLDEP